MTPEKVPMQDPGIWGYMGLIVGGFVSKVIQGEAVSWKWVAGLAGTIILLLLTLIGSLSLLGIRSIQTEIAKIETDGKATHSLVVDLKSDMKVSHAKVDSENARQDDCIKRIEVQLDKMRGKGRFGGGEMGDSR